MMLVGKAFEICNNNTYEMEVANSLDLLNALVENHPQSIEIVLESALAFGSKATCDILKLQSLNVICLCFAVNFQYTCQQLTKLNIFDRITATIVQMAGKFNQPWELHRLVICLSNLIKFWVES